MKRIEEAAKERVKLREGTETAERTASEAIHPRLYDQMRDHSAAGIKLLADGLDINTVAATGETSGTLGT